MKLSEGFVVLLLGVSVSGAVAALPVNEALSRLTVPFVPNMGQWDPEAAFAAQTLRGTLFVTRDGRLVYRLPVYDERAQGASHSRAREHAVPRTSRSWVLTETLVDAQGATLRQRPIGTAMQAGRVTHMTGGNAAQHRDGAAAYGRLELGKPYPGIAIALQATDSNVEKIFTVDPKADPSAIRVRVDGGSRLEIGSGGELVVHTDAGRARFTAPIAYQESDVGARLPVGVRYALAADRAEYGFAVESYDRERALVIDPLLQSTYLGGTSDELGFPYAVIAIHPGTGEVYVAGSTFSATFPKTTGAEQPGNGGSLDVFITRLNAALTTRLQSTFLGGTGDDTLTGLAIHPLTGEIYVSGITASDLFPKAPGSEQPLRAGSSDGFVTRLNPALTSILQSTYLGGTGADEPRAMAIHPATGEVYITGTTTSTAFPKVGGAEATTLSSAPDVFVTRMNANLTQILQSTYLGTGGGEIAYAIAISPFTGEIYVGGAIASAGLPKATNSEQPTPNGSTDGFVTRLNQSLTMRLQSSYLGGSLNIEWVEALAVHPLSGELYAAGRTNSTDFPKVLASEQPAHGGGPSDGFVTRFNAALTTRIQSTYLGAAGTDYVSGLAIHPLTGDVYVAGLTNAAGFPKATGGDQPAPAGALDAFVTRLNAALTTRLQSTYLGGSLDDLALGIATHPTTHEIYVVGRTNSALFPGVGGSEQTVLGGSFDAFVSRYSFDLLKLDSVPGAFSFAPKLNVPLGSQQTSAATQITGLGTLTPISIAAGGFGQFCISSTSSCSCDVVAYSTAPTNIANNQFVCIRQNAPFTTPAQTRSTLVVGGGAADFVVTTGSSLGACSLDLDGNGAFEPLSDALMLMRMMFGLTGTSVTANAVPMNATRPTYADIRAFLNGNCGTSFAP